MTLSPCGFEIVAWCDFKTMSRDRPHVFERDFMRVAQLSCRRTIGESLVYHRRTIVIPSSCHRGKTRQSFAHKCSDKLFTSFTEFEPQVVLSCCRGDGRDGSRTARGTYFVNTSAYFSSPRIWWTLKTVCVDIVWTHIV